jgi:hypothetical protein
MNASAISIAAEQRRPSARNSALTNCLACGAKIASSLSRLGSLRCHDCRDTEARLDPLRVHEWRRRAGHL